MWAYLKLVDLSSGGRRASTGLGNVTFAVGLIAVMIGITYGIQPYGHHTMSWTSPKVLAEIIGGLVVLAVFCVIETRVEQPMFHLDLFRIRAFAAGNVATLLSAIGRGGLQFVLIIWLQGIWLPQHGYSFEQTPLWAGIYMLPLTAGFLIAGPASGFLSDRYGARPFATGGMLLAALSFILLEQLPVNFDYVWFALLLVLNGVGMGLFASPNRAGVMNSLPPRQRGAGAGMNATFQNSAMVLSIGIFFSLLIIGLASHLPASLRSGLTAHGVPAADAVRISHLPPVATLFAAFLGYNPIQSLLGPHLLHALPASQAAALTGRSFFPQLMGAPFSQALSTAFTFSFIACLVAAWASWLRGGKYHYREEEADGGSSTVTAGAGARSSPRRNGAAGSAASDGGGAMTLVALSASYGAGGSIVGPALARRLNVPFIDRAIPLAVADRLQVPFDDAAAHDEQVSTGWLERVLSGFMGGDAGAPAPLPAEMFSSEDFRRATEEVLLQQAATGQGVILGRGSVVLLRELSARASRTARRAARAPDRAGHAARPRPGSRRRRAGAPSSSTARMRATSSSFYGVDIRDSTLYHLALDSTCIELEACVEIIASAAEALAAGRRSRVTEPTGGR